MRAPRSYAVLWAVPQSSLSLTNGRRGRATAPPVVPGPVLAPPVPEPRGPAVRAHLDAEPLELGDQARIPGVHRQGLLLDPGLLEVVGDLLAELLELLLVG